MAELALASENPAIWGKPAEMQKLNKEKSFLEKAMGEWKSYHGRLEDAKVLLEMAVDGHDEGSFSEVKSEIMAIEKIGQDLELNRLLNGEMDTNSSYLSINSGAGGTESCDWAEMLMRMYLMWAEARGFATQITDREEGTGAGVQVVTIHIKGEYARLKKK